MTLAGDCRGISGSPCLGATGCKERLGPRNGKSLTTTTVASPAVIFPRELSPSAKSKDNMLLKLLMTQLNGINMILSPLLFAPLMLIYFGLALVLSFISDFEALLLGIFQLTENLIDMSSKLLISLLGWKYCLTATLLTLSREYVWLQNSKLA